VMDELFKRGMEVGLAGSYIKKYDVLVESYGCPPKPVHVRSACESMVCPQFQLCRSGCKTSLGYVLLGLAKILIAPRFFVTKNSGMETEFRQPPDWLEFGFIDVEAVECTRITGIF
jgi:hypothetical protein